MTTVTVLAGERTIGGTQIVVEDGGARLLFDCGLPFSPASDPFAYVRRRPRRDLSDLIRLGLVPYVPDLYGPDFLVDVPAETPFALPPTGGELAVALSHSHLDHTHLVGFVDHQVPVYASEPTARIVSVLSESGASLGRLTRPLICVQEGHSIQVGPMRVHMLAVDHDVSGARGLLIETSDGAIAYSGDLRLHGRHPTDTLAFAAAVRRADARLLILEGTRLAPPAETPLLIERSEADVVPEIVRALREAPGQLGVVLLTPENGERVEALAGAANDIGRLFVADVEGLALSAAALGRPIAAPHAAYLPTEVYRAVESGEELLPRYRAALDAASRILTAKDIAAQPGDFLLRLSFRHFADLLDLAPAGPGGLLIASNGPPLGPFDPAWLHLAWWAERLGLRLLEIGSTGHATPRDLALIAERTGAPTVMSLHSRHPELMPVPAERLLLPERGRRYDLAALVVSSRYALDPPRP